MKSIEEFLSDLDSLDIKLWVEGDRLRYNAPKGSMTSTILSQIKECKAEIVKFLVAKQVFNDPKYEEIKSVNRDKLFPLSFAQSSLWLLEQIQPNTFTYNETVGLKIIGSLSIETLEQSINEIVRRHEILRTNFRQIDEQPVQIIHPNLIINLPIVDLCQLPESRKKVEIKQFILELSQQVFDLVRDLLLRFTLFQISDQEYILFFAIHHMICDGWSLGIFVQELSILYETFSHQKHSPLSELPIQYADFAVWEKQWQKKDNFNRQINYWKKQLSKPFQRLKLPIDKSQSNVSTNQDNIQFLSLSRELSEALKVLSLQERATLFMTLVVAFNTVLYFHSDSEDVLIGTDVANRNLPETEELIGFFVNQLVLRTDLGGNPTFRELLARVRQVTLEAYANQDLPFGKLVEILNPERASNGTSFFQVKIMLRNFPLPSLQLEGLTVDFIKLSNGTSKLDLFLSLEDKADGIGGFMEYNQQLFNLKTIQKILTQFEAVLTHIVRQPECKLDKLIIMLSEEEKQQKITEEEKLEKTSLQKLVNLKRKAIAKAN